mgnify:CR=1 FL=1
MNQEETIATAVLIFFAAFALILLALYVWSLVWLYGDSERRGKPGCLVVLLVALIGWPLGLLLWVVVRPETTRELNRR